jgi:hypothetical protein
VGERQKTVLQALKNLRTDLEFERTVSEKGRNEPPSKPQNSPLDSPTVGQKRRPEEILPQPKPKKARRKSKKQTKAAVQVEMPTVYKSPTPVQKLSPELKSEPARAIALTKKEKKVRKLEVELEEAKSEMLSQQRKTLRKQRKLKELKESKLEDLKESKLKAMKDKKLQVMKRQAQEKLEAQNWCEASLESNTSNKSKTELSQHAVNLMP